MPKLEVMKSTSRHTNSRAYQIPRSRTDYHLYSFFPRTIRDWNLLAEDVVQKKTLEDFKKALDDGI